MAGIAKIDFSWKSFLMFFRFLFFGGLESRLSGFLGLENRLENEAIFSDITDPEKWIW